MSNDNEEKVDGIIIGNAMLDPEWAKAYAVLRLAKAVERLTATFERRPQNEQTQRQAR
jgi:hypothetical protein